MIRQFSLTDKRYGFRKKFSYVLDANAYFSLTRVPYALEYAESIGKIKDTDKIALALIRNELPRVLVTGYVFYELQRLAGQRVRRCGSMFPYFFELFKSKDVTFFVGNIPRYVLYRPPYCYVRKSIGEPDVSSVFAANLMGIPVVTDDGDFDMIKENFQTQGFENKAEFDVLKTDEFVREIKL